MLRNPMYIGVPSALRALHLSPFTDPNMRAPIPLLCILLGASIAMAQSEYDLDVGNATSSLLHLSLSPDVHLDDNSPSASSVSQNSISPGTSSPDDLNPVALMRPEEDTEEEVVEVQQPESCVHGVAEEPCTLMDVRRRCGAALPIGIDPALNYTFHKMRLSLVGANFSLSLGFHDQDGNPPPMLGHGVIHFSDILATNICKRSWRSWALWGGNIVLTVVFGYAVTKVLDYLPMYI
ncbi:hypothetical protein C8Q77DRAFT_1116773 [Trametes polyzona]|nr:hypothetical protein C8Q77DRAFT_1116773 [Trametes polyzona]